MRLVTYNLNGVRAAQRRGLDPWLRRTDPDVLGCQEVRCPVDAVPEDAFPGRVITYDPGVLAGRNGVAMITRTPPLAVRTWAGSAWQRGLDGQWAQVSAVTPKLARGISEFASEGRYLEVDLADAAITVASLYLPKGGLPAELQKPGRMREAPDGGAKYERKMRFLDVFARQLAHSRRAARAAGREFVLMGDLNIAHLNADVRNWRTSRRSEGFLPIEREWLDAVISPRTLVDVVRGAYPDQDGPYSWWSWMGQAFAKDVGWRIDHQLVTPALAARTQTVRIGREAAADERISDHAPVIVDYQVEATSDGR
ncbi:exodeoxyribonuclease III [Dermacoccaceae bacterium W4C1]